MVAVVYLVTVGLLMVSAAALYVALAFVPEPNTHRELG
jgi:hypothetical protein